MEKIIVFGLGGDKYSLNASNVLEILDIAEITPVSNMSKYIQGVAIFQRATIPILDLCQCLGLQRVTQDHDPKIIVVRFFDDVFGFTIDYMSKAHNSNTVESRYLAVAGLSLISIALHVIKKNYRE